MVGDFGTTEDTEVHRADLVVFSVFLCALCGSFIPNARDLLRLNAMEIHLRHSSDVQDEPISARLTRPC